MSTSCATLPSSVKLGLLGRKSFPRLDRQRSRCGLSRRGFVFKGIVAAGASVMATTAAAEPTKLKGLEELPFKPEGYNYWTWRDRKIHYVVEGEGLPIVLIHGFGASAFHWSLGGFTALVAAASLQDQVKGVVLLNSAGQFGDASSPATETEENAVQKFVLKPLKDVFQRVVLGFLFWQAKQPARVESVLKSVYVNSTNVDDYLINSITRPADDPNAGEVYYRLMTRFMSNQRKYTLDSVLSQLSCPLLLVWGDLDPWVGPAKALRIKEFYPGTSLVNLQAGHCPHDEVPELVNKALLEWLPTIPSPQAP
ncbi:pheophytinase, chloroplastic isoform X3 [Salvia miltiorrhiza]|uniref:pheophytinase, chloroplastic isoform X3 n=1 Tax=Salvia miltiorrhiza TaxID=226208 RepID=UPI0025AC623A|nr:pheophytinase, chloroplastic isoform X3 [Salvia miltiorrhiza]